MNDEKEVKLDDVQIVRANEFLGTNPLAPYGQIEVVRAMSRRIRACDKSKVKLSPGESIHLAQLAISHDLNPFSGEIWGWIVEKSGGVREFNWMPGRRGLIRHANEQAEAKGSEWWSDERELTEHEKKEMMIPADALAFESKVFDKATMDEWRKTFNTLTDAGKTADEALRIGGNPPCSIGYGVLTQQEIKELDKNRRNKMPHVNRVKKRALMEALKGKYSLHFGGAASGVGADTFEDYIVDSKGAIDVEFEDVEEPYGMEAEAFGGKDRLNPKFWNGACEKMVEAELARDPFVAAELLAYSLFIPGNAKGKHLTGFFQNAKEILIEEMNADAVCGDPIEVDFKSIAEAAYGQLFDIPEKKTPDKKEKPDEAKAKPVQKKPEGKTEKKKQATPKQKKESPSEPDKIEGQPKKTELTKKEANALVRMAEDYPAICPTDKQDWATAYKYIDLKESGTTRKEFVKLVNDEYNADVRLGMAHKLGYL